MNQDDYRTWATERAAHFIKEGHQDPNNLRELLILTTNRITEPTIATYFRNHHNDDSLLKQLVNIALEGEDAGDAPWAAANTLAEFPCKMLANYEPELVTLSEFEWPYLSDPARAALAKLQDKGG